MCNVSAVKLILHIRHGQSTKHLYLYQNQYGNLYYAFAV